MTPAQFRRMALDIPGAVEASHQGHVDFRVGGKIFATLGYPDDAHGMLKLSPAEQAAQLIKAPTVLRPCAGAWGRAGCTSVRLAAARVTELRPLIAAAAANLTLRHIRPRGTKRPRRNVSHP